MEKLPKRWTRDSKDAAFHSQYIPEKIAEEREELVPIEIIVTKSQKSKLGDRPARSKFETDLDD
jgi:hypothetical protein